MGLSQRSDRVIVDLTEKIRQLGVKRVIMACPGCFYELRDVLKQELELLTVYQVLRNKGRKANSILSCTVHDSCPDRDAGIFASQVRQELGNCGYTIVEMPHSREDGPCCGSGGQLTHLRPDLAEALVAKRLQEARETGAAVLVAYCLACVLNLASLPSGIKVRHALNLILGYDEDYTSVKVKARQIFAQDRDGSF